MLINSQINQVKQLFLLSAKSLLKNKRFFLLSLVTNLAVLHLGLVANHPLLNQEVLFYALGWAGIILLLWRYRQADENTAWYSSCLGLVLLFLLILRPLELWYLDTALFRLGPIVAALGLGLLAFGFPRTQRQWRSFLLFWLLLFPIFPYTILSTIIDKWLHFSHLTTVISAFLLHYIGLKATYHDVLLTLPTGQVTVGYFCTGGPLIVWLLKLSLLLVIIFPLTKLQQLGLALSAIVTGFLIGCVRVALLAVVVNNHSKFEYWHGSQGGQIFLVAAILIFVGLCNWLLPLQESHTDKHYEQSISAPKPVVKQWHYRVLATTWIGVVFATIYFVCVLLAGRRLLPVQMPNTLSLNGWRQISATSLREQTSDAPATDSQLLVQSSKQYRYLKNHQQLEIQMRYVVNTTGELNPFLSQLTKTLVKDSQKNTRKLDGIGYYTLYTDGQLAYLTACINPRGGSTVTSAQFIHNRYTNDFTWSRILPWVLGEEILKDDRCIWAQLSTPLNRANSESVYQVLESVWAANYTAWRSQFPLPSKFMKR